MSAVTIRSNASHSVEQVKALIRIALQNAASRLGIQLPSFAGISIPSPLKWLAVLLFLINIRSMPFYWHFRVFRPIIVMEFRAFFSGAYFSRYRSIKFAEKVAAVGKNPFEMACIYRGRATLDDCDWNGHLSNSCYLKTLDPARMKTGVQMWRSFYADGGWMALGGTNLSFIREIPIGAKYEVHLAIGGWEEEKWLYLTAYFLSFPGKSKSGKPQPVRARTTPDNVVPTPSETPDLSRTNSSSAIVSSSAVPARASPSPLIPAPIREMIEKRGAVLHCVAISQYCFKLGRVTIPPPVVVGVSGFGVSRESPATKERWTRAKKLRQSGQMRRFLKEGWKGSGAPPPGVTANGHANGGGVGKEVQKERKGWADVPREEQWWRLEPELEKIREEKVGSLRDVRVNFGSWAA